MHERAFKWLKVEIEPIAVCLMQKYIRFCKKKATQCALVGQRSPSEMQGLNMPVVPGYAKHCPAAQKVKGQPMFLYASFKRQLDALSEPV